MTDQFNQQSPAPVETAVETPSTPSLEDIAKELSVTEQAQQFTQSVPQFQPQPQYQNPYQNQPTQFRAPDPITDPEGYNSWMARQAQTVTSLDQTLQSISQKIQTWEQRQAEDQIKTDINRAVSVVNEKLKIDPQRAEVELEYLYRTNPSFKTIWDNRARNPAALDKALNAVADKLAPQFQMRQDPKIAGDIRAARMSQQTMATTQKAGVNDGVPSDPQEFQRYWNRLISGG